jgi:hypothetical protein
MARTPTIINERAHPKMITPIAITGRSADLATTMDTTHTVR